MKNKKVLPIIILVLIIILCTACNKDYELEDANRLLQRKGIRQIEYLGEGAAPEERDTVWMYRDKKTDQVFQVIEDHYTTGIDGSSWEASTLYTNYACVISGFYLSSYTGINAGSVDVKERNNYPYELTITYEFTDRSTLESCIQEAIETVEFLMAKNRNARPGVEFVFDETFSFSQKIAAADSKRDFANVEGKFLNYALAYYDEDIVSQFTEKEIQDCLGKSRGRIYIEESNGKMRKTDAVSLAGNTFLFRNALRHLLIDEGYNVAGNADKFSVTFPDGSVKIYSDRSYSYTEISKDFGLTLVQQADVNK